MRRLFACLMLLTLGALVAVAEAQTFEDRALRSRIEARYDVVPIANGIALTPKARNDDVRLIEISDAISINGTIVTGRELRDRIGDDADDILKLSYLEPSARRALFVASPPANLLRRKRPAIPAADRRRAASNRSNGDRVRVFGDVTVREGEEVSGEVVSVLGSVQINGDVGSDVVSVLGSVDLGEKAVIGGDVVSVGGRVNSNAGRPGPRWRDREYRSPTWTGGCTGLRFSAGSGCCRCSEGSAPCRGWSGRRSDCCFCCCSRRWR